MLALAASPAVAQKKTFCKVDSKFDKNAETAHGKCQVILDWMKGTKGTKNGDAKFGSDFSKIDCAKDKLYGESVKGKGYDRDDGLFKVAVPYAFPKCCGAGATKHDFVCNANFTASSGAWGETKTVSSFAGAVSGLFALMFV